MTAPPAHFLAITAFLTLAPCPCLFPGEAAPSATAAKPGDGGEPTPDAVQELRTLRLRLLDRQRAASASDDDAEAKTIGTRIERLDRQILDAEERSSYLARVWDAVDCMGGFLVRWADQRTGRPLHSFDTEQWRDTQSAPLLLAVYLGTESALDIARGLGHERPGWEKRELELRALIRYRCFDNDGNWQLLPPWPIDVRAPDTAARHGWDDLAEARLAALDTLRGEDAARTICNLALLWQRQPEKLQELEPRLASALEDALYFRPAASASKAAPRHPDTLTAALAYIAAHIVAAGPG